MHDFQLAKSLLEGGANPNVRMENGVTPLWLAVSIDDTNMIKLLIDHGADINLRYPPSGGSLLDYCNSLDKIDAATLLLKRGLNPDTPDSEGQSPLIGAIFTLDTPMVSLLLKFGANPNFLTPGKETPLTVAIFKHKSLKTRAHETPQEIKYRDSINEVQRAIAYQIIKTLLKSGASLNSPGTLEMGFTYLHDAVAHCDTAAVQLLLQYGADRNAKDSDGNRPYDIAVKNGCKDLEAILK
jgi:ankyrin repeat protein